MIEWLQKYQEEAIECEVVVLATILNPCFRGKFFAIHYPDHEISSNLAIEDAYNTLKEEHKAIEATPPPEENFDSSETDAFDIFGVDNGTASKSSISELDEYLQGSCPIKKDQTPLAWWNVSHLFRIISSQSLLTSNWIAGTFQPFSNFIRACARLSFGLSHLMCLRENFFGGCGCVHTFTRWYGSKDYGTSCWLSGVVEGGYYTQWKLWRGCKGSSSVY